MALGKLHIVYATDSGYLMPSLVAAGSAIYWASRKEDLIIDILDCGIKNDEWESFLEVLLRLGRGTFEIRRHKVDMSSYAGMKEWHTSRGIYSRLDIPNILHDVQWCIYADGDTLFTADPFALEEFFDGDLALLGHLDYFNDGPVKWHVEHGLPWDSAHHICAGFILMNLKWFRENDAVERCFELLKRFPDIPYNDQDVLNIVCMGKIGLLPDGWGCYSYTLEYTMDEIDDICCIHYTVDKPWTVPNSGRAPITSIRRLWFTVAEKVCGMAIWKLPGWNFGLYHWLNIKTYLFVRLFRFLNSLPWFRGRYEWELHRHWSGERMKRFSVEGTR